MGIKMKAKLKKVVISGFKSVSPDKGRELEIELSDVNLLLGANGSGKSNIIGFFRMLNYMMGGGIQLFVERAGTSRVFLHFGAIQTAIKGELYFEDKRNVNNYCFQLAYASPDKLIIPVEEVKWGDRKRKLQKIPIVKTDYKESVLADEAHRNNKSMQVIRTMLSNCKVFQFHDSSPQSPVRQSSHIDTANYLQAEGGNLASFLYLLKKTYPSSYNRIVSYVNLVMPQFKDFYLEPNGGGYVSLKWTDIYPNDYVFLPEQFSDGTIRFIALATVLLQPDETIPRVIIIDEPELGLHPFAIGQLAAMIKEAAKHTQVIIATQSPGLVDEFDPDQITVIEADREYGYTTARKLKKEELKDWLESYSLSELWDKNVIGGRP
jgi:predicted ATPase